MGKTISAYLIVKDEELVLDRCLSCLDWCSEIVVVDTGSTDHTTDVALSYGANVYDFEWCDDFSAARNFALNQCSCEYAIWIDADDIVPKKSQEALAELLQNAQQLPDAIFLPYNVSWDADGNVTLSYYRERIVRTDRGFKWQGAVHECIDINGTREYLDIPIEHCPIYEYIGRKQTRNLDIYRSMDAENKIFSPRELFYYARELKDHGLDCEAIDKFNQFLEDGTGWVEDCVSACICLAQIYVKRNQECDALASLYRSFCYGLPKPETCCRIANIYFRRKDYEKAIYWYMSAIDAPNPTAGFICMDFNRFIPAIQLCVCYEKIGESDLAVYWNEEAAKIKPNNESVNYNREYFEKR